jgi:hypothetical protein
VFSIPPSFFLHWIVHLGLGWPQSSIRSEHHAARGAFVISLAAVNSGQVKMPFSGSLSMYYSEEVAACPLRLMSMTSWLFPLPFPFFYPNFFSLASGPFEPIAEARRAMPISSGARPTFSQNGAKKSQVKQRPKRWESFEDQRLDLRESLTTRCKRLRHSMQLTSPSLLGLQRGPVRPVIQRRTTRPDPTETSPLPPPFTRQG